MEADEPVKSQGGVGCSADDDSHHVPVTLPPGAPRGLLPPSSPANTWAKYLVANTSDFFKENVSERGEGGGGGGGQHGQVRQGKDTTS